MYIIICKLHDIPLKENMKRKVTTVSFFQHKVAVSQAAIQLGFQMKKSGILNSDISRVLSYMGHTDTICIGDCGLPIPAETERIDLSVRFGSPSFMEVLEVVAEDMVIESIILAEEIKEQNPGTLSQIQELIERTDSRIELQFVSHNTLKEQTKQCKAILRTGETTPYANIILVAGCIFA
jgi:D-ribose pyranase